MSDRTGSSLNGSYEDVPIVGTPSCQAFKDEVGRVHKWDSLGLWVYCTFHLSRCVWNHLRRWYLVFGDKTVLLSFLQRAQSLGLAVDFLLLNLSVAIIVHNRVLLNGGQNWALFVIGSGSTHWWPFCLLSQKGPLMVIWKSLWFFEVLSVAQQKETGWNECALNF